MEKQIQMRGFECVFVLAQNSKIVEERENLRRELAKKTDLTDEEIEALLNQYAKQMASLDKMLSVERARQAAVRHYHYQPRQKFS